MDDMPKIPRETDLEWIARRRADVVEMVKNAPDERRLDLVIHEVRSLLTTMWCEDHPEARAKKNELAVELLARATLPAWVDVELRVRRKEDGRLGVVKRLMPGGLMVYFADGSFRSSPHEEWEPTARQED
jgi:hypothetical protein